MKEKLGNKHKALIVSAIVFAVLIIVVLAVAMNYNTADSQGVGDSTEDQYVPESIVYDDVISEPIYDGMPDGVFYKEVSTRTVLDTASGSRIVLIYPIFGGYEGLNTDDDINLIVTEYNRDAQRQFGEGMYKMIERGVKVVYEITDFNITYADADFISILYEGFFGVYDENDHIDTGNKNFSYSLNIDVKNREIITSDKLIRDFGTLKSIFLDGEMQLASGMEGLLDNSDYDDMIYQYNEQYKVYPMLCFSKDTLMLIISLTSDLGGNAVFSYGINDSRLFLDDGIPAMQNLFS